MEPAHLSLQYTIVDGNQYIDIAKDLSRLNRRLYRQGRNYVVAGCEIHANPIGMGSDSIIRIAIGTAGNTWTVQNAWKKGYSAWRKQIRETSDITGIKPGTWDDYKIYLDDSHEDATELNALATDGASISAGEWDHSKLVFDDDGVERELGMHIIGSSNLTDSNNESGIGLIYEYSISRSMVPTNDPKTPADASNSIFAKMLGTNEMSDMLVDNVEGDNDSPPYDQANYVGGDTNSDAVWLSQIVVSTASFPKGQTAGFVVPCGLLLVGGSRSVLNGNGFLENAGTAPPVYIDATMPATTLIIHLAPGGYRGVLAPPMGQ